VGSKFVSAESLLKTGVSAVSAGDFREILARVAIFRSLETSRKRAKIPQNAGFSPSEWLAGAGGIEPPNGGIKISLIIQRFQGAFGKNAKNAPLALSIAWQSFPNKEAALTGRISLAKSEATGCARADCEETLR
jgi:hypothetical protein